MPRQNQPRTIASESHLAERIARERKRLDLSYEGLAKAMTEAGCSIAGSAIYRIEKGDPPRTISVTELVAFSQVFARSIDDLLTPIDLIDKERAQVVVATIEEASHDLAAYVEKAVSAWVEWYDLERDDAELSEYAMNHLRNDIPTGSAHPISQIAFDERFERYGIDLSQLITAAIHLSNYTLAPAVALSKAISLEGSTTDGQ